MASGTGLDSRSTHSADITCMPLSDALGAHARRVDAAANAATLINMVPTTPVAGSALARLDQRCSEFGFSAADSLRYTLSEAVQQLQLALALGSPDSPFVPEGRIHSFTYAPSIRMVILSAAHVIVALSGEADEDLARNTLSIRRLDLEGLRRRLQDMEGELTRETLGVDFAREQNLQFQSITTELEALPRGVKTETGALLIALKEYAVHLERLGWESDLAKFARLRVVRSWNVASDYCHGRPPLAIDPTPPDITPGEWLLSFAITKWLDATGFGSPNSQMQSDLLP